MKVVSVARFVALEALRNDENARAARAFAHPLRTLRRKSRGMSCQHSEPFMACLIGVGTSVDSAPMLGKGLTDLWLTINIARRYDADDGDPIPMWGVFSAH